MGLLDQEAPRHSGQNSEQLDAHAGQLEEMRPRIDAAEAKLDTVLQQIAGLRAEVDELRAHFAQAKA